MKTCVNCGWRNHDSAEHCSECGKNEFDSPLPNLPVSSNEKEWIETSYRWLINEFGAEYFLNRRTILPEQSFFPDKYVATQDCVLKVAARVCAYMDVDPQAIEFDIFSGDEDLAAKYDVKSASSNPAAAGLYYHPSDSRPRPIVAINNSNLKNPTNLVATIAHELGHVILLGGGRISRDDKHHEDLTDLITVFLGMGIFTANAAFQFRQWQSHSRQGWNTSRLGYLSEEKFAYALACYARLRTETKPDWAKYLSMNLGAHFKQCHKYFLKGGETNLPILKT